MPHADYKVTSKRPYLIRAMHEWMSDNSHTPHLVVDAAVPDVVVPSEHIKDGRIVLNISFTAAHALSLGNDVVTFRARFSGQPFDVSVPVSAVLGIYARETGQGMVFADGTDSDEAGELDDEPPPSDDPPRGPHLKIVK